MRNLIVLQFLPAFLLLVLQETLAARISSVLLFCDIALIAILLNAFFARENDWLFVSVFVLGLFISVWSARPTGFDSLLYSALAYFARDIKKYMPANRIAFSVVLIAMEVAKFLWYVVAGFMLGYRELVVFAASGAFWLSALITLVLGLIACSFFMAFKKRKVAQQFY